MKMADWVSIVALIIAVIGLALAAGAFIWFLIVSGSYQITYTITEITGDTTSFKYGGANAVLINSSTSAEDLSLTVISDNTATKGKVLWIVNKGSGKMVCTAESGVNFPETTLNTGSSASYILTGNNQYVRMI